MIFSGTSVKCMDVCRYQPDLSGIDFIIGGPPCQTFSAAGRRANGVLGTTDARGVLFKEYVRILDKLKPRGFLFENVYGIVGAEKGEPWKQILESFSSIGYSLHYRVLDAADYGVPQHRERLIIIGLREGVYSFPRPMFGPDSIDKECFYTAEKAIDTAPNKPSDIPGKINGRYAELIPDIPPGLNYSFYTEKMGHPKPVFSWRSKFSDFMYKADPEQPVRTIKAQGGQYTGPFHWENRHFSIPEYKRLQTFPDAYELMGTRQKIIHQIGNSVPPQLARILALSIREQVFGRDIPIAIDYLSESEKLTFRKEKAKLSEIYKKKADEALAKLSSSIALPRASREYRAFLGDNFNYVEVEGRNNDFNYIVKERVSDNVIEIEVIESSMVPRERMQIYNLKLTPSAQGWGVPFSSIHVVATGDSPKVLTVAWKAVEKLMAREEYKADLVQLGGYYQYPARIEPKLDVLRGDDLSGILRSVSEGKATRRMMSTKDISETLGVDEESMVRVARSLRHLGYEVRNKNTNAQIPLGFWLIPYEFPTLSPLSVQLKKSI